MIPETNDYFDKNENAEDFEVLPSRTYKLDFENKRILGMIDREESVLQFVTKVLSTDKYAHEIYDWYYGNEILKLVGQPYEYIVTTLPRIIKESLLVDDRITDVTNFRFDKTSIDSMTISFTVENIYSNIEYSMEVPV